MKVEENPYAAPQAPGLVKTEPREGALWYVSEGVLLVRDGASLPDICLSGAAPGDPGERDALEISWCPAWIRHLPSLVLGSVLIWGFILWEGSSDLPGNSAYVAMAVVVITLIWLVRGVSKRGRFHLFRSDQAKREENRRDWVERLIVLALVLGGGFLLKRITPGLLPGGGMGLITGISIFLSGSLGRLRQLRPCGFESGWFALTNVHPAAIARLEEIQSRPDHPPLSRKPS
ncbi:MAG TPA: hypothetical protein VGE67_02040 [Haloferula sp.]